VKVIERINDLKIIDQKRPIALIPTMGNLHEGHLSLVKQSLEMKLNPLVTIYVNPLQFGPNEDFEKYPRTLNQDKENLKKNKCAYLYLPEKIELLEGIKKLKAPYSKFLCAKKRPGHFDGVITIVNRFLELIQPEYCFFGQKDFQQQLIIQNHLKANKLSTKLIVGETVRDENGLALSSRNNYLTQTEKKDASIIYKYLNEIADQLKKIHQDTFNDISKSTSIICKEYKNKFKEKGFDVDYLAIVNSKNLEKIRKDETDLLIAIAVHYRGVRLIDNLLCDLSLP
jgi:pantoate--beta-alanine ligase